MSLCPFGDVNRREIGGCSYLQVPCTIFILYHADAPFQRIALILPACVMACTSKILHSRKLTAKAAITGWVSRDGGGGTRGTGGIGGP